MSPLSLCSLWLCPSAASAGCAQAPLQVCHQHSTPGHRTGTPQLWGSCKEFPLPLPKTPSLFCAFIPYSCDHLGAMLSLSFPDSAGISGSFPLHLLLQKAPGLRSALPPVFVGLSLPPRPPSPLHPLQKSSRVSCHLFLFSPGSCSTVTSDLPALFLRGWGKTWPTFAWCQFSSLGRLLHLPRGRRSRCRTVSSSFSSWLGCSWRDWFEKIWGPPQSCSIEFASSSLPLPLQGSGGSA